MSVAEKETHEQRKYSVQDNNNEILIRLYGQDTNPQCAIFFHGRHGGVYHYEKSIFQRTDKLGIAVYALSFPGYEGALGSSTPKSISELLPQAISFIEDNTQCKITNAVFIGRSLGASIALQQAVLFKPKALLLDSVSTSLTRAIKHTLQSRPWTYLLSLLPIELLITFELNTDNLLRNLRDTPIVIFQGSNDWLTPINELSTILKNKNNVTLHPVTKGTHATAYKHSRYFDTLQQLSVTERLQSDVRKLSKRE